MENAGSGEFGKYSDVLLTLRGGMSDEYAEAFTMEADTFLGLDPIECVDVHEFYGIETESYHATTSENTVADTIAEYREHCGRRYGDFVDRGEHDLQQR